MTRLRAAPDAAGTRASWKSATAAPPRATMTASATTNLLIMSGFPYRSRTEK